MDQNDEDEKLAESGQKRRGIYKFDKTALTSEEKRKKIDKFVYKVLEEAEKEEFSLDDVEKISERISRYVQIAEYTLKTTTKYNAPGCYLR